MIWYPDQVQHHPDSTWITLESDGDQHDQRNTGLSFKWLWWVLTKSTYYQPVEQWYLWLTWSLWDTSWQYPLSTSKSFIYKKKTNKKANSYSSCYLRIFRRLSALSYCNFCSQIAVTQNVFQCILTLACPVFIWRFYCLHGWPGI